MKVCPKCNSSYSDETLVYCLTDGEVLISDKSVVEPPEAETVIQQTAVTTKKAAGKASKADKKSAGVVQPGGSKWAGYIVTAAILVLIGVGGYWIVSKGRGGSPTDSYKGLYAAVKSKDTEAIKKWMSKKTLGFAEGVAAQQKQPIEEVFKNGFTGTTFAASLPPMRDERIKDDMGALEVWNSKDQRWEDLPFVKEEGGWKLAVGDLFAGTYESPGKGQAAKDAEEANKMTNNTIMAPNVNGNFNGFKPKVKNIPMPPPANGQSMKGNLAPRPPQ
jgi:hypothetical protein